MVGNPETDMNPTPVKRLFYDLETSPNVVLSWRVGYKINIDSENILKERAVICIGYKWQHEAKPHVITWDKKQDDKAMLAKFLKEANKADELVAHNGDKFDLPWFLTRCAYHGLATFPSYKTADTLQWAKRRFNFNSNRLNYIAQFFGIGGKLHTEFGLWKAVCLENSPQALARMSKYCAHDVVLLEKVWERLSALVPHKTHAGVASKQDKWSCPHCASEDVCLYGTRFSAHGTRSTRVQCKQCRRFYFINDAVRTKYEESKK